MGDSPPVEGKRVPFTVKSSPVEIQLEGEGVTLEMSTVVLQVLRTNKNHPNGMPVYQILSTNHFVTRKIDGDEPTNE